MPSIAHGAGKGMSDWFLLEGGRGRNANVNAVATEVGVIGASGCQGQSSQCPGQAAVEFPACVGNGMSASSSSCTSVICAPSHAHAVGVWRRAPHSGRSGIGHAPTAHRISGEGEAGEHQCPSRRFRYNCGDAKIGSAQGIALLNGVAGD